ncbi:MAG: hypothetical protein H7Y11_14295 [Armatimonadetes bacterium]|nr:hypothetical protein [Anaerolineae bacterium]
MMNRLIRPIGLLVCLLVVVLMVSALSLNAQASDGAFCVRSYQDLDSDGVWDLNETELKGGVSANLVNDAGIIIASALLENADIAPGVICFQNLAEGQYTIEVVSADYRATTASTLTNFVRSGETPFVMEFGAHSVDLAPNTAPTLDSDATLMRVGLSLAGAGAVVLFMTLVGFMIYLIGYRGRLRRATDQADAYYQRPPTSTSTGGMPRVTDTGEFRPKR